MNSKPTKKISFVVPVWNESSNIGVLYEELSDRLAEIHYNYEIIFVDDGSTDNSLQTIKDLAETNDHVFYVELSRNFGHQYALKAGLDIAEGDCVISMDCDLQHPPEIVKELIAKWENG